ncbi:UNVERIFIED_CONTAM: hypothetical protein FKN15_007029 [Acipenser sinensis]
MDCLLGQRPVVVAAGHFIDTSQHAASEPFCCLDEATSSSRDTQLQSEQVSEHLNSDATDVEQPEEVTEDEESVYVKLTIDIAYCYIFQCQIQQQQVLFQQAELRRQHDWSRWMRQQQQQHQETVWKQDRITPLSAVL